jgi:hypothetical protein
LALIQQNLSTYSPADNRVFTYFLLCSSSNGIPTTIAVIASGTSPAGDTTEIYPGMEWKYIISVKSILHVQCDNGHILTLEPESVGDWTWRLVRQATNLVVAGSKRLIG